MGILSAFRFAFQNLFFTPILYGVIASLAVFSTVWDKGDRLKDQITDPFRSQQDTFDFIIVGGGSAGAVLASRLSQFHTVLLLEAGGETHPFQAIPGLSIFIPKNPGTDWSHKSIPQTTSCFACRHKKYILSQGRNLGGSGNINYMMHLRGNPLDFNNWATITGDPAWSYEGVLPYFIQSEHFVGETTDKTAHGFGGPLQVQIPDCISLAHEWNLAGEEMGYPHIDLNGRYSEGFDTIYYPIKHGVRQATYRSYIQPVRGRKSLLIRKFAHVNKILIRETTFEAYGVEYDRHGQRKHAIANKEVIISAGALQTPKLLILSGVGQLEHLNALHIPVRAVLPVGKNLQDHFSTLLGPFYINKPKTISFDRDIDKKSFVQFAATGKGPLSTTGFQAAALLASSIAKAQGQEGWPDIQLTLFGLTPHRMFYSDIGHAFGIKEEVLHRYYGDVDGKENAFFIMVTLARPLSKGDFCVSRRDPYKPAAIDPNFLSDSLGQDLKVMIEGVQRALFLAENTTVFQSLNTVYSRKCFPGCEKVPFRSEAYWECYIRSFSIAMNDHVGTCPMGKIGSPYAVVDPELQVQGIKGLRVVDASVMPTIIGAPTQAATIMIAEKASALILEKWKHDAKTQYGPPGVRPGPPLPNYGPPGAKPHPPLEQYGPPGGPPIPVGPGDQFNNYDSFSVIKDQLSPGGFGVTPSPTPLIPLPPNPQEWITPPEFGTPKPTLLGGIGSTPVPGFQDEPSTLLIPPDKFSQSGPGPTYATSYVSSNVEFHGPVVSTTPDYTGAFSFDNSGLASGRSDTNVVEGNLTISRQGKSFGDKEDSPSPPEGNQLGQGLEDEDLLISSPSPTLDSPVTPDYSQTTASPVSSTTSHSDDEVSEVVNEGPDYRIVRKRLRTTPRVVVHPRGHLGHQNVRRNPRKRFNETVESILLTTSSIRPVPKNIVKIKRRRPVVNRRQQSTTTPATTLYTLPDDESETIVYSDATDYTTAAPITTTYVPQELNSPVRKRFVRRMFARPINFGKRQSQGGYSRNGLLSQSSAVTPIIVTVPPNFVSERPTTTDTPVEDDDAYEEETEQPLDLEVEITTEYPHQQELPRDLNKKEQANEDALDTPPVVIFKNIELEDANELSRQTRSYFTNETKNSSGYFEYNIVAEESRNPIMVVDLNPVPEIIVPKAMMDEGHETVAVPMDTDNDDIVLTTEPITTPSEYYDDNEDVTDSPNEENYVTESVKPVSSQNVSLSQTIISTSMNYTVAVSSSRSNSSSVVHTVSADSDPELDQVPTVKPSRSRTTVNPRFNFRMRNKLIRTHS